MTLYYFPQWQGAGDAKRFPLQTSAGMLRRYMEDEFNLSATSLQVISPDNEPSLLLEQGIFGRRALLQQLDHAVDIIDSTHPARLGVLGGDCAVELAPVSYLNRLYGDSFALLWVDAHADLNLPETSPSHALHGMPLRMLLGAGDADFVSRLHPLRKDQVCLVGVRDVDPAEQNYIEQHELALYPAENMQVDGEGICRFLSHRGTRQVYFHLDLDALDPMVFPQVGFPADGGLSVAAVVGLLQTLQRQFDVVGVSMTEYLSPEGQGMDVLQPILGVLADFGVA